MEKHTVIFFKTMRSAIAGLALIVFATIPISAMLVQSAREVVDPYFKLWLVSMIPAIIATHNRCAGKSGVGTAAVNIISLLCGCFQIALCIMVLWRIL